MLWFFERHDESLTIDTRYDNDTSEFVAIVRYSDGREQTKRFSEADEYGLWLDMLERSLEQEHWTRHTGGPVVLPDGWPNKHPS